MGVGPRSFVLGKGIQNPQHPGLGGWGRGGAALARSFSSLVFVSYVFNDLAWREIKASEPSSPKPDAPCKSRGACGGAGGQVGCGRAPGQESKLGRENFSQNSISVLPAGRAGYQGSPSPRATPSPPPFSPAESPRASVGPGRESGWSREPREGGPGGRAAAEAGRSRGGRACTRGGQRWLAGKLQKARKASGRPGGWVGWD